jgi:hypothetical protein
VAEIHTARVGGDQTTVTVTVTLTLSESPSPRQTVTVTVTDSTRQHQGYWPDPSHPTRDPAPALA